MCVCLFPPERETQADPSQKPANTCEKSKDKKRGVGEKENGHWVHEWRQGAGAGRGRHRGHGAQRVRHVALPGPGLSLPALLWLPWQVAQPLFWSHASRSWPVAWARDAPLSLLMPVACVAATLTRPRSLQGCPPLASWHPHLSRLCSSNTTSPFLPEFHAPPSKKRSPSLTAPCSFSFG